VTRRRVRAVLLAPVAAAVMLWWYVPGSGTVVDRYTNSRPSAPARWSVVVDPDRWGPTRIMHPSGSDYRSCVVGVRWPDCKRTGR
jgi:hypothetical protein